MYPGTRVPSSFPLSCIQESIIYWRITVDRGCKGRINYETNKRSHRRLQRNGGTVFSSFICDLFYKLTIEFFKKLLCFGFVGGNDSSENHQKWVIHCDLDVHNEIMHTISMNVLLATELTVPDRRLSGSGQSKLEENITEDLSDKVIRSVASTSNVCLICSMNKCNILSWHYSLIMLYIFVSGLLST